MQKLLSCALGASILILSGCLQLHGNYIDQLVIGEVLMNSEFQPTLRALATPGGRLSGSTEAHQAELHVLDTLKRYGYRRAWIEPFSMTGWRVNRTEVTLLTEPTVRFENAVALGLTLSTPPDGLTAKVISVGGGSAEEFDAVAEKLENQFALVTEANGTRRAAMILARERGALGVLYADRPNREPTIGGCHEQPRPEPAIAIRHEDAVEIAKLLATGKSVSVNVKVEAEIWDARPNNVVAEIPGSGPLAHEQVVLCAHLDSWHLGEGAIDNANGAAVILETARALQAVPWKPRRTVRFIWFMAEEQDLLGSKAYVAAHQHELDDVVAVINVDMPGIPRRFVTFGHPEIADFLDDVRANLKAYEIEQAVAEPRGDWSDHAPFMHAGVCTLVLSGQLGEGVKHYHTAQDLYDIVDRPGTVQSAAVFGVLIRRLADHPERPSIRRQVN